MKKIIGFILIFSFAIVGLAQTQPNLKLQSPASHADSGILTIAPGQCGFKLVFSFQDNFAFIAASRRDYIFHRVDVTGDAVLGKETFRSAGIGQQTYFGKFETHLVPGATYYVQRGAQKSQGVTIQCGSSGSGSSPVLTSGPTPASTIKDCPLLYPNHLGALSGKPVCMAKAPIKLKSSKCANNGGQIWNMSTGAEYCIFSHAESWHARPTK